MIPSLQHICKAHVEVETLMAFNLWHLITPIEHPILLIPENMVLVPSSIIHQLEMLKKNVVTTRCNKGTLLEIYDAKMCAYLLKRAGNTSSKTFKVWKGTKNPFLITKQLYEFIDDLNKLCLYFDNFTTRPKELVYFDKFNVVLKQVVNACCYKCGELVNPQVMNLFVKPIVIGNIIKAANFELKAISFEMTRLVSIDGGLVCYGPAEASVLAAKLPAKLPPKPPVYYFENQVMI